MMRFVDVPPEILRADSPLLDGPDDRPAFPGDGITKQVRWVTLTPAAILPEDELAGLLRDAARVDAMSRSERLAIAMSRAAGDGP